MKMAETKKKTEEPQEEDVFALLERIEAIKQPTIDKLLADRSEIDRKLAALGHLDAPRAQNAPRGRPKGSGGSPSKPGALFKYNDKLHCKTCDVKGHDLRAHRNHPAKFTADELASVPTTETKGDQLSLQ